MAVVKRAVVSASTSAAKPASAPAQAPANVASMNPDTFVAAGLMDDFDGTVVKARFVPWDYNGKIDHHVLGVALTIQPEDGDAFTQTYSCGELDQFVPSMDGQNPVDLENGEGEALEGVYALRVGKKDGLNNNTNWAQWVMAALEAGFPKESLSGSSTCFEGVTGHWNRIPQKKRAGIVQTPRPGEEGKQQRQSEILVLTEYTGMQEQQATQTTKAVASKPVAAKSIPAQPASSGTDLDELLAEIVIKAVAGAGDDGLSKQKLPSLALKGLPAAHKAKGVKRITEADFLEDNDAWAYDPDSGTLYAA